jgi:hypothetical protein
MMKNQMTISEIRRHFEQRRARQAKAMAEAKSKKLKEIICD